MGTYSGAVLQRPATPSDLLRSGLESNPDGLALVSARTRLTWQTLDDLSTRLASGYLDLGLEPGDRIASLMPNRFELVLHYLGRHDRVGAHRARAYREGVPTPSGC